MTGETVGKLPGEINGQQFIIQNCQVNVFSSLSDVRNDNLISTVTLSMLSYLKTAEKNKISFCKRVFS